MNNYLISGFTTLQSDCKPRYALFVLEVNRTGKHMFSERLSNSYRFVPEVKIQMNILKVIGFHSVTSKYMTKFSAYCFKIKV